MTPAEPLIAFSTQLFACPAGPEAGAKVDGAKAGAKTDAKTDAQSAVTIEATTEMKTAVRGPSKLARGSRSNLRG